MQHILKVSETTLGQHLLGKMEEEVSEELNISLGLYPLLLVWVWLWKELKSEGNDRVCQECLVSPLESIFWLPIICILCRVAEETEIYSESLKKQNLEKKG